MAKAAAAAGFDLESLIRLNFLYEIVTACTSIVARKPDGRLIHGRNLDFDFDDLLRDMTININFLNK